MRILYVITGLGIGGAERQVVDLANSFVEMKHAVTICYLTGENSNYLISDQIKVFGLGIKKNISGLVSSYFFLRQIIRNLQPDIVHSHMVHANLMTRLVRLSCRIPRLICTAHNSNEGGKLRMIAYRLTDFLADVSTNVSAEAVAAFEDAGAVKSGRMIPMYNGIDTDRFRPSSAVRQQMRQLHGVLAHERIIIAVGRLNVAKDYPNLLHSFSNLTKVVNNVKLWIIGDGELRSDMERLVNNLNINKYVKFWGIQNNVVDWMNAADVFALSSAWEGFALVVAEAMACQKVVVATNAGGVKEVLGDCGFLVPVRDANALSAALKKAVTLRFQESKELGIKSRERILANFSLEKIVLRWQRLYYSEGIDISGV